MSIEIDCTIGVVVSWIVAIDPTRVRFPDGAKFIFFVNFCQNIGTQGRGFFSFKTS